MLGVDEAGRGPLAGPVAVGAVCVSEGFDVLKEFRGVADSKKLSEKNRDAIFTLLEKRAELGDVRFAVEFESAEKIDQEGIVAAVSSALSRAVRLIAPDASLVTTVQLDGSLYAPDEYRQETIVNGDELVPLISLASVAAKVSRDNIMIELAKAYPQYGFEQHKGYGTKLHYEMLNKFGPCVIHRQSFIHLDSASL
jgi:ribonuclease HII